MSVAQARSSLAVSKRVCAFASAKTVLGEWTGCHWRIERDAAGRAVATLGLRIIGSAIMHGHHFK